LVAGAGEFLGYALRLFSGYLVDRTRRYWLFAGLGYLINLLSVPALALAGSWQAAALLMLLERLGKAVRNPARDVMLSQAGSRLGRGFSFGLHEALDQIGAVLGPALASGVLALQGNYRQAYALFGVTALLALAVLLLARLNYPRPEEMEEGKAVSNMAKFGRAFWLYLVATGLVAAGYADFPLIAFRLEKAQLAPASWLPLVYALAMGTDALGALLFGRLFDRLGPKVLVVAVALPSLFAPLVFLGSFTAAIFGMFFWGLGMGAQESILRAAVAGLVPAQRRGTAYGLFNAAYGLSWFAGSALMGMLLESSPCALVMFSLVTQMAAAVLFLAKRKLFTSTET